MADINITPENLANFASKMGLWSSQISNVQRSMRVEAVHLGNTWKDSAYGQFLMSVEVYQRQLATMEISLREAQVQLKRMAETLRQADQERRRRLGSMR